MKLILSLVPLWRGSGEVSPPLEKEGQGGFDNGKIPLCPPFAKGDVLGLADYHMRHDILKIIFKEHS